MHDEIIARVTTHQLLRRSPVHFPRLPDTREMARETANQAATTAITTYGLNYLRATVKSKNSCISAFVEKRPM